MNWKKFFLLSWKKIAILLGIWIMAVFFHNMISSFFIEFLRIDFEEPVFFVIAVILIPVYFIISFIYTIFKKVKKK